MSKLLLISGSNRKGNTEYILNRIQEQIKDSELILLRKKKIEYCRGCLSCHQKDTCVIEDDMKSIIEFMLKADVILFGVPNYFDNVTGLFKNFIDRLHPLYKSEKLKGKKVFFVYVGGGKVLGTEEVMHQSTQGVVKYLKLDFIKEFSFQALHPMDMKKQEEKIISLIEDIQKIVK